jgi:hypothetical protein
MPMNEEQIEDLVDQLLADAVPGYKPPERKKKAKPAVVKDGFESSSK